MTVSLSLEGKTALITGGSRGIGAETVRLFVEAGARVAFNYRAAWAQAEALVTECGGPDRCVAIERDLSSPEDGRTLVRKAVDALGRLDILVANHGIWESQDVSIAEMSEAQWRRTLAVNLDAVFGLVQEATGQMLGRSGRTCGDENAATTTGLEPGAPSGLEAGAAAGQKPGGIACGSELDEIRVKGHIVLISSTAGQRGEAYHADYAVTKGALISLTKSLSSELAPKGIMVNCVAPGWVHTDMSAAALADPALGSKIAAGIPVGRVATPREIAGPVLFLCTPLAGFISGEIVNVNGGAVLVG
jgi:3-oxoacyl-[acyl-carrier protein] reductase